MVNEELIKPLEVGTVLKETYDLGVSYYIVGSHYVYENFYDMPNIRPHKFVFDDHITIASDEERTMFIEMLRKNHLIWDQETGTLKKEYETVKLSVELSIKPGTDINKIIEKLNIINALDVSVGVYEKKFTK